jgi:HEPN domain
MNRTDLQKLAEIRLQEAKILLDNNAFNGAYYLCGYGVECALKSCVAKNVNQYDFPDKNTVINSHTHDLKQLIKIAGLSIQHEREERENRQFSIYWNIVSNWKETSRYEQHTSQKAIALYQAINDPINGIMTWIQTYW